MGISADIDINDDASKTVLEMLERMGISGDINDDAGKTCSRSRPRAHGRSRVRASVGRTRRGTQAAKVAADAVVSDSS